MNAAQKSRLLRTLQTRFEENMARHPGVAWSKVQARLESADEALRAVAAMEETGGEPDVVGQDRASGEFLIVDCCVESPAGRRSLCYDEAALKSRRENRPDGSATGAATRMGVELLTEEQYRHLQTLGCFDLKTSSWIQTPPALRRLGGALFCDRRYDRVFVYHNGAQSYYAARGFRAVVRV